MKDSNRELEEFFSKMKNADQGMKVPEFEELFPKRKAKLGKLLIPMSIAASILLALSFYVLNIEKPDQLHQEDLVITIGQEETSSTSILIPENGSIDQWESPTNSLIEDFYD